MKRGLPVIGWMSRVTSVEVCWVALALSTATGILLAPHFDADAGQRSVATWLLAKPLLTWLRAIHFWSAALLVAVLLRHVAIRVWRRTASWSTARFVVAWLVALYAVVSGFLLRGDPITEPWRIALATGFGHLSPAGVAGWLLWGQGHGANPMYVLHAAAFVALLFLGLRLRSNEHAFPLTKAAAVAAVIAVGALVIAPGLDDHGSDGKSWWRIATEFRPGPLLTRESSGGFSVAPPVRGRPEGCLGCHATVRGLGDAHDPAKIGCAACHRGDAFADSAGAAHRGLVRVSGNLTDAARTCGHSGCHASIPPRVEKSIMTTMAGVVAVDRAAFGEAAWQASPPPDVRRLGHSAADTHVRQLCASCHLGQPKSAWGEITEASRGGGCNACHLTYSPTAAAQLAAYQAAPRASPRPVPVEHPALSASPPTSNCFGCHSRSSRIALNYEGWREVEPPPAGAAATAPAVRGAQMRPLEDGRVLVREPADIHAERGLDCVDCHGSPEVMGKDLVVGRKAEQSRLRCEDCHAARLPTLDPAFADTETATLLQLRGVRLAPGERLAVSAAGDPLVNVLVGPTGAARLLGKRTSQPHPLRPPTAACARDRAHRRLACEGCHSAWAPRCVSCHTAFDPKTEAFDHLAQRWDTGAWIEQGSAEAAVPPTLGVRRGTGDPAHPDGVIDSFIPGMILELDRSRTPAVSRDPVFLRLYARIAPHTTRREARSCDSCHRDPVALGFGEGTLRYVVAGAVGHWKFQPRHAALPQDGLPADAWTGFLQTRTGLVSTRPDVRPFDRDEQWRILRVGACFTCHPAQSAVMRQSLADFPAVLRRCTPKCALPE